MKTPEGWMRVPVEPTEAMHAAANREWDGRMSARSAGVWQAMCAAAPKNPNPTGSHTAAVCGEGDGQRGAVKPEGAGPHEGHDSGGGIIDKLANEGEAAYRTRDAGIFGTWVAKHATLILGAIRTLAEVNAKQESERESAQRRAAVDAFAAWWSREGGQTEHRFERTSRRSFAEAIWAAAVMRALAPPDGSNREPSVLGLCDCDPEGACGHPGDRNYRCVKQAIEQRDPDVVHPLREGCQMRICANSRACCFPTNCKPPRGEHGQ